MNCTQCQAEFDRLLDGPLDGPASAVVRRHLADCPDCAAAWRAYEAAWAAFVSIPEAEPSSNFVARVMSQIDREEAGAPARGWLVHLPWRRLVPAMAAALFLVAGAGVWMAAQHEADQIVSQELAANLPVVQHLDLLKDFDIIADLDRIVPSQEHDPIEEMMDALWNS